jgi:mannitol-1-phosphate 5-dehydrogenase
MKGPYTLGIDVGTSATKVLLLDNYGEWEMGSWPTSEGVWPNLKEWLNGRGDSVVRAGITGHGPSAIVIRDGAVIGNQISWFDKIPEDCIRDVENDHILPPTRAWVPSRLAQWEKENGPIGDGVALQLKDLYNWELTGVVARDTRSMRGYSGEGNFFNPDEVIGQVNSAGSEISGIVIGAEVICGCDDLTAGVLGLNALQGDLFNLANTSEHVGLVGGEPLEGLSWLPALGKLPTLCYNATSTGGRTLGEKFGVSASSEAVKTFISQLENEKNQDKGELIDSIGDKSNLGPAWQAISELNKPIQAIQKKFPDGSMLIGGGLALIPQIVESRGAVLRAGQEVSVLGVARLAQRPLAVIFGAGKVGRGFLAQLLLRAGWRVHFVDSNLELVQALKEGSYAISNLATGEVEVITEYTVSNGEWRLEEASLILTSLGANGLANWAQSVSDLDRDIDIILAENHPAPAKLVRQHISSSKVGVAQAQVLRSCIEPTEQQVADFGPLTVQVQDHWTLPLDADSLVNPDLVEGVEGFVATANFSVELTRKLYTYNAINAAVCYLGAERGHIWLSDAANDSEIANLATQVGVESSAALVAEFDFDEGEQRDWSGMALAKYQDVTIRDPIERNARDPIRKLGLHDRILGPLHLCIKHGLPHEALIQTMKSALTYREPSDSAAIQLELYVDDFGAWGALQKVAVGLDESLAKYVGK